MYICICIYIFIYLYLYIFFSSNLGILVYDFQVNSEPEIHILQVARSTCLKTKNYVLDANARVYCADITTIREDAPSMVTAGATANTTEGNSRTSRDSGCYIHIHTGNLSLLTYRNTQSVCMLNTSNPTRSFQVARSTALKTKNYVFDVNARVYCGCVRIHIHEFKVILLYVRRLQCCSGRVLCGVVLAVCV